MSALIPRVKKAAGAFLRSRGLKPTTAKGYEALLSFYCGWFKTPDGTKLPPYVVLLLSCGRQSELID